MYLCILILPTRFLHTRNETLVGHAPEADSANAEFAIDSPGTAAETATESDLDPIARPEFFLGRTFFIRLQPRQVPLEFNAFRRGGHDLFSFVGRISIRRTSNPNKFLWIGFQSV
jgi:hypothetical protein